MTTNQEARYNSFSDIGGVSATTYNESILSAATANSITVGTVNERLLQLMQLLTGSTSVDLNGLLAEYAAKVGVIKWNEGGYFNNPLDLVVASSPAAFSLRKLSLRYAGDCIRLRRSSDNAEQDIGFIEDARGRQIIDTAAISSFLGVDTGFVVIWYDQSGNGIDAAMSNASYQPILSLDGLNGLPSIDFDGVDTVLSLGDNLGSYIAGTSAAYATSTVFRLDDFSESSHIWGKTGNDTDDPFTNDDRGPSMRIVADEGIFTSSRNSTGSTINEQKLLTASCGAQNIYTTFDYLESNANKITTTVNGNVRETTLLTYGTGTGKYSDGATNFWLGGRGQLGNGTSLDGGISEFIFFGDLPSATDASNIQANVVSYWGLSDAFTTSWKTDNTGTSNNDQITIPTISTGTYDCRIYWGDDTYDDITTYDDAAWTHTYAAGADTYRVSILGNFHGFRFNNGGDAEKLVDILRWGANFRMGDVTGNFYGCANLVVTATDIPDISDKTNLQDLFRECESLTSIPSWREWDMTNITSLVRTFKDSTSYNQSWAGMSFPALASLGSVLWGADAYDGDWTGVSIPVCTGFVNMGLSANAWTGIGLGGIVPSSGATSYQNMGNTTKFNQDFRGWPWANIVAANNMLSTVSNAYSTANYDDLLIYLDSLPSLQSGWSLGIGGTQYSAGAAATARASLITKYSLTITDGGQA